MIVCVSLQLHVDCTICFVFLRSLFFIRSDNCMATGIAKTHTKSTQKLYCCALINGIKCMNRQAVWSKLQRARVGQRIVYNFILPTSRYTHTYTQRAVLFLLSCFVKIVCFHFAVSLYLIASRIWHFFSSLSLSLTLATSELNCAFVGLLRSPLLLLLLLF